MTKAWDSHEATIKKLYADNTLAVVRKIMIEEHNFKASTRAYRGRLIKWGVRKYNCRRRSDCGSVSCSSPGGSSSGSDTSSPTLSRPMNHGEARYPGTGQTKDSDLRIPNPLGRSYDNMDMGNPRTYEESYGRNRPLVSPPQDMQYEWSVSPTQPATSPTSYNRTNMVGSSAHYYGYPPLTPALSTYSSDIYGPGQTDSYRRQSFPLMTTRNNSTTHDSSTYSPMREYEHGQSASGIGSIDSICDQDVKHSPAY
ncbi:hypothetical protein HD806DRAFT_60993 [Xylariaceae sp. AK1471]|nr:hypothetical protein HD806DRAFT_60993 [Xylariaceae sp. AK1471]